MRIAHCAAAIAAAFSTLPALATTYHLVDLGADTSAHGVNPKNHVAGSSGGHAALYQNGAWHAYKDRKHGSVAVGLDRANDMVGEEFDGKHGVHLMYYPHATTQGQGIPLPGGNVYGEHWNLSPGGISPDGSQVTGTFEDDQAGGNWHCFQWSPGEQVATDIGLPAGYDICEAYGINKSGEIVGQVWSESTGFSAFVYRNGAFSLVGPHGNSDDVHLAAVNATGHATGDDAAAAAVFWDGTNLTVIPQQGVLKMYAGVAMNLYDQVVGWGSDNGQGTIMMYSGGTLIDLVPLIDNPQGWDFTTSSSATGINDAGVIVGNAYVGGTPHAFMLIPD